jgi:hypothetical protein
MLPGAFSIFDFRFSIGDWRLEIGDWRLEIGDWRLEIGDWRLQNRRRGERFLARGGAEAQRFEGWGVGERGDRQRLFEISK